MNLFKIAPQIFILALLASCASVDVVKTKTLPPKAENCTLEVFFEIAAIKKPYEVACILGSSTGTTLFADRSVEHAVELAKRGADAILIDSVSKTGMSLTGYGQGSASIKAIVYK